MPLAYSYELDDAPAFERFFFATSAAPFPVTEVVAAANELAGSRNARERELSLPAGVDQTSMLIAKEAR